MDVNINIYQKKKPSKLISDWGRSTSTTQFAENLWMTSERKNELLFCFTNACLHKPTRANNIKPVG
jgi:hypothetical protein